MVHPKPTLEMLSYSDETRFVKMLGGIFEHSPWVAAAAWESRPFTSADSLHKAMVRAMHAADSSRQLTLIRAHPELAGWEACNGSLTANSKDEQSSAGLNHCTAKEREELRRLNGAYIAKFGFPFIMAVKNRTRHEILTALAERMKNSPEEEFARCLEEIAKIAGFRLEGLLEPGK